MVSLGPVLRRLLPPGDVKVLLAQTEGVADKHRMPSYQASSRLAIQRLIAWDAVT